MAFRKIWGLKRELRNIWEAGRKEVALYVEATMGRGGRSKSDNVRQLG